MKLNQLFEQETKIWLEFWSRIEHHVRAHESMATIRIVRLKMMDGSRIVGVLLSKKSVNEIVVDLQSCSEASEEKVFSDNYCVQPWSQDRQPQINEINFASILNIEWMATECHIYIVQLWSIWSLENEIFSNINGTQTV